MMGRDTLGSSGCRGSKNLGELASGDYLTFGALIWFEELTNVTFLFLTGSETMLFELGVGDWCTLYSYVMITSNCHPHKCIRPS